MLLKPIGLLLVVIAGGGLASSGIGLRWRASVAALVLAIGLHTSLGAWLSRPISLGDASTISSARLVLLALSDTAGFWLPIALVPWAPARARVWTCLYLVAAATLTLVVHYYPFDVVLVEFGDGTAASEIRVEGPQYAVGWLALTPVAAVGFLIAKAARRSFRKTIQSGS